MTLYGFGFGRSVRFPTGCMAHEAARLSLIELRELFVACHDGRERSGLSDRDVPRYADGMVAGAVSLCDLGIRVAPPDDIPVSFSWTEVFGGLSLAAIRELLALAYDTRSVERTTQSTSSASRRVA